MTRVEKTITVNVPLSTAYNEWTQFEDFPRFMGGVERVTQMGDDQLEWVAKIGGVKREWVAQILEQVPDQKVAWAAVEGAANAGEVTFTELGPDQTDVHLMLEFEPDGFVEQVGDKLHVVENQAERDLESFKEFIESRGSESGAWRGAISEEFRGSADMDDLSTPRRVAGHTRDADAAGDPDVGVAPARAADLGPTTNPEVESQVRRDDLFGGNASRS